MKIVYLNLAADQEPFTSHLKAQKETWAAGLESQVIWIFGSESNNTSYDAKLQRLELPVQEKFENILAKSVEAIKWALVNLDFDFLVRGNTSNYYDDLILRHFLTKTATDNYFVGSEIGFASQNNSTPTNTGKYLSGTGIVLSRDSAEKMQDINVPQYQNWPDDVAISHHLSMHGLVFTRIPRGDITDFKPLLLTTQYRVKSWTDQDHTSQRMYLVDSILKLNGFKIFPLFIKFNVMEYVRYSRYFPIFKGLNVLRHVRQCIWITRSIVLFPILKSKRTKLSKLNTK